MVKMVKLVGISNIIKFSIKTLLQQLLKLVCTKISTKATLEPSLCKVGQDQIQYQPGPCLYSRKVLRLSPDCLKSI